MTKVSVIVPCYNQAQFISEALESVQFQSYNNWECIIVNDGSPDNTDEIASEWLQKDSRFKYIKIKNGGLSNARNVGIENASGEFILPLDADDKISSEYIKLAIEEFNKDDALKIMYCKAEYFGEKSGEWRLNPYSFLELLRYNSIFCSALFRVADWKQVGGYDVNMKYGLEDWEFWIHMLKHGGQVKQLEHIGFYYRIKEDSMINKMTPEHIVYSQDYVLKKHRDTFYNNYDSLLKDKSEMTKKLRSKKSIINLFTQRFFGFSVFKN